MEAFDENIFLEFYDELEDVKTSIDNYKREIEAVKTSDNYTTDLGKLCYLIKVSQSWTTIISEIGDLIPRLNEIVAYCVQYPLYYLSQIIIKYTQLIALTIKKITLTVQIKIAEITRQVTIAIANGKGPAIAGAIASGAIAAMQAIAQILNVVMQAIQTLLNALIGPLSIPAEGMCFFMTPKTIMTGQLKSDVTIANPNISIIDYLPEPIKLQIQNIIMAIDQANVPIKISFIAASAALGAGLALTGTKIEINPCVDLSKINVQNIINAIEAILMVSIIPQPLPKYEKLLPINVGFMIFLMSGFNAGGKLAFGLPGFP